MKPKILIVDDEEKFLNYLSKRLNMRDFHVTTSISGEDCVEKVRRNGFDVVIMDVVMPGMNGIETLRHIKEIDKKPEVILLTAHATTQDGVEGIKSGAFDYLTKPVQLEHLIGKVKQAYEKILREDEKEREAEYRVKMEERLIAAERMASLGTLAAGVAHEINNPLAIINDAAGLMKLMLHKEELAEMPQRDLFERSLDKIEKSVERAKRITHQLLVSLRKSEPMTSEVDLQELVGEAVQLVHREAESKEIEIVQESHPSAIKIWTDPYPLRQVLINLLTNAIDATERKGKITLSLEKINEETAIGVCDTGQGIPKENLQRIFEPFFSTKSPGKGTGLGLFVSRGIVEKLGGTIEVESRLGQGTCFRIKLPRIRTSKQGQNQNNTEDGA